MQLSDDEMKKFYLEGLTEENQRKLFEECLKFGMCKIYTKYFAGNRGKLKPTGILSFIRKNDITPDEFKTLSTNLSALGIKISNYVSDKGVKCSIKLHNFYEGDASRE